MNRELQALREQTERLTTRLPGSSSKDEALGIAIEAAEAAVKALSIATDAVDKANFTTQAHHLLAAADRIKQGGDWRASGSGAETVLKEPLNSRKLPTREQIVLEKAGFLNGFKFPRWQGAPASHEVDQRDGEALFLDEASELRLSHDQRRVLDGWKRPSEALPPPSWSLADRTTLGPVMSSDRVVDLVQDVATDCSVVASLCASEARTRRGHATLTQHFFHPFDAQTGRPRISRSGKYIFRLNFNGCYRKVVIDDRIPTSRTDSVIHVVDRNNPALLWPALIEKAYLKVRGGYDFPGSNSGTDLWILTGWIPEQVFLQSDEIEPDRLWRRIFRGFSHGDVLVTMGTGKMSRSMERDVGLAGEHDYAVLDLREIQGQRLMLVKNPWIEGTSWQGRYKAVSTTDDRSKQQALLVPQGNVTEPVESPRDLLNADDQLSPGTFWMDFDTVLQYFESIYLNWNTALFSFRQDCHFLWDLSGQSSAGGSRQQRGPYASLQRNPQYTISVKSKGDVWVLLWRHLQNSPRQETYADHDQSGCQDIDLNGHIALTVFAAKGHRVLMAEKYLLKTWFVDSPQTLLKLEDCEAGQLYTIVPLEQSLSATTQSFTLSTFGHSPLALAEAAPRHPHTRLVSASWTRDTAGGNAQTATYSTNPQFQLMVSQETSLSLLVEACDCRLNVNIRLLHSGGERMYRVRRKDIIVDSKEYRPGCCLAELETLSPGRYTAICSTFEPQQLGDFTLLVESSQAVVVTLLPREDAGRTRISLDPVTFRSGQSRIAAPILPHRLVNLYATARYVEEQQSTGDRPSNRSQVRLGIELGTGPHRQTVAASNDGEYADTVGPVRTSGVDLGPNFELVGRAGYWLVLDRMYGSSAGAQEETFSVELFADRPGVTDCGAWECREETTP